MTNTKPTRRELIIAMERAGAALANAVSTLCATPAPLSEHSREFAGQLRREWDLAHGNWQQAGHLSGEGGAGTAAIEVQPVASDDLADKRRTMFAAYSKCLVDGDAMTPDEIADRLLAATQPAAAPADTAAATLEQVYKAFGVGELARTPSTLMTGVRNTLHFADLLHAVEREFFMVPVEKLGPPFDDEDDDAGEPQEECLLNCWGSTVDQYVEQFRAALAARKPAAPSVPTDLSKRMRDRVAATHREDIVISTAILLQAADEIERYYGGMMAWKQTAEKKDADWSRERMERINERCAARAAAPRIPAQAAVPDEMTPDQLLPSAVEKTTQEHYCDGFNACRRRWLAATPSAPAAPDTDELHFNAQRLRNVATLVGLTGAVPEDDATLDGARGAVLGQIAAKLRAPVQPVAVQELVSTYAYRTRPLDSIGRATGEWSEWVSCTREQYRAHGNKVGTEFEWRSITQPADDGEDA